MTQTLQCDVLIIGSGASGLMAALAAHAEGLKVIVIEKEPLIGGTSARSGGWLWVPGNPISARAGIQDDPAEARRYIRAETGARCDAEKVEALLAHGPEMVAFCEARTMVRFSAAPAFPDYHMDQPGAALGRPICAQPFDARPFGTLARRLQKPLRAMTFLGMAISSGGELGHFFNATRSLRSLDFVIRRLARHGFDLLRFGQSMRLANGNALVGRLLASVEAANIPVLVDTAATDIVFAGSRVSGASVSRQGAPVTIETSRGIVLATGGFQQNPGMRKARLADAAGAEPTPLSPAGNTGDGLAMGLGAGGQVHTDLTQPAAWAPVSEVCWPDGTKGAFAHIIDRAKPGVVAVLRNGRRFVDESCSYHDFVVAMRKAAQENQSAAEAFLVCDHATLRKYGLGFVKPFPIPLRPHLRSGYLLRGRTLRELAGRAGIDAEALAATIDTFNPAAAQGMDPQFGKGQSIYGRYMGDQNAAPNPCTAPLLEPPFYAVRVTPGVLTTYVGLRTDASARVLDPAGQAIPGLYAVGSDAASLGGGGYLGGGANLGPGMTFGYIAGRALASEAGAGPAAEPQA